MINSIDVSVIIPAYNEENRIGAFLDKLVSYCNNSRLTYEVIVVDDCSTDDTVGIAAQYEHQFEYFLLLRSKMNSGKDFNFLVQLFLFRDIRDTQCGFKIFRREVIRPVLSRVQIDGFGFDLELLYLAQRMGYKIK